MDSILTDGENERQPDGNRESPARQSKANRKNTTPHRPQISNG